jgi:phosphoglycolate phosphatase-like HAD superfamily hydrolase
VEPILLLFDIDLTLVKTGGAGLRAMHEALTALTGYSGPIVDVQPDGKTDPLIVEELFRANKLPYAPEHYEPFMRDYLARLEHQQATQDDWTLLPGVRPLLDRISETPGLYPALVTGNDERGARLKLTPFDLNRTFPVGGFASDSAVRRELIPIAISRAAAYYGVSFARERVIVIGDAVGDVRCAADEQVRCLALTTGHTSAERLRDAGPCLILPDLSDTESVLALLLCPEKLPSPPH